MRLIEADDHADLFVPHAYPERRVDLGEVRLNYVAEGDPTLPALLLIPAQAESWWGYEAAIALLTDHFQVFAVDLRGQGRSTWTPGRYTLDLFGGDLVRFLDRVVQRPAVVSGLSSGATVAAWLSAFAAPDQVTAAVYEDPPLFTSETNPACGPSIRQGIGPMFSLWNKWLGDQWSVGDWVGLQRAIPRDLPPAMLRAMAAMAPAERSDAPRTVPQDLKEYDPEWGRAFTSGTATASCDHETMLSQVKVPVLLTHHFHQVDEETGALTGALTDLQALRVGQLVESAGASFTYRSFPTMPHSMHGHAPQQYADTLLAWHTSVAR